MTTSERFESNWQRAALDRSLRSTRQPRCLMNVRLPGRRGRIAALDDFIMGELWSAVVRSLATSPWTTRVGPDNGEGPREAIRTLPGRTYMTRRLEFLIEDPKRPNRAAVDTPAWFCRGELAADTKQGFMVSFSFTLRVPETFAFEKVLPVLKEPLLCGCPPASPTIWDTTAWQADWASRLQAGRDCPA